MCLFLNSTGLLFSIFLTYITDVNNPFKTNMKMSCHVATVSALEEDLYYDGSNLIVRKELPNNWLPANQFHLRKQF